MTTAEPHGQVVVREPGTGRGTWAMSSLFEHLLESPPGSDRLGVALVTQPPGVATPLHRHTREAEAFYLLDGRMDYRAGDDDYELYAGCFMYLPAGLPTPSGSAATSQGTRRPSCVIRRGSHDSGGDCGLGRWQDLAWRPRPLLGC